MRSYLNSILSVKKHPKLWLLSVVQRNLANLSKVLIRKYRVELSLSVISQSLLKVLLPFSIFTRKDSPKEQHRLFTCFWLFNPTSATKFFLTSGSLKKFLWLYIVLIILLLLVYVSKESGSWKLILKNSRLTFSIISSDLVNSLNVLYSF